MKNFVLNIKMEEKNLIGLIALLQESSLSPFRVSSMTF